MDENPNPEYVAYPRAADIDPRQYHGPPDFRINVLNEAWLIYKSDLGLWVGGYFLILLLSGLVSVPASLYTYWRTLNDGPAMASSIDVMGVTLVFGFIAAAASGAMHGGFLRLIVQKMRLQHEGFGGLFDLKGQGWKLAVWSAIYAAPVLIISTIYSAFSGQAQNAFNPDIGALFGGLVLFLGATIVVQVLIFPFFLTPLLIVDQRLSIAEAAAVSWKQVSKMYFRALVFYIVMGLVAGSGAVLCGIGLIFTLPLYQLAIAVAYRDNFMPPIGTNSMTYNSPGPFQR